MQTCTLHTKELESPSRQTTGFDPKFTRRRLESMETCDWKAFFAAIEARHHKISNVYAGYYLMKGRHPFHNDKKFSGTHRWIISLGCLGKEFWLKCKKTEVGLMLRHGMITIEGLRQ